MDSNMLDTAMLCNCSGIRTRSVVNEYENMCQSCHKQIRDDRNVVRDRNLREVMVLSGGSEDDEPVYENPVDSRVKAAGSNKNSESNQTGSETHKPPLPLAQQAQRMYALKGPRPTKVEPHL